VVLRAIGVVSMTSGDTFGKKLHAKANLGPSNPQVARSNRARRAFIFSIFGRDKQTV
jgi:hypothetical protein